MNLSNGVTVTKQDILCSLSHKDSKDSSYLVVRMDNGIHYRLDGYSKIFKVYPAAPDDLPTKWIEQLPEGIAVQGFMTCKLNNGAHAIVPACFFSQKDFWTVFYLEPFFEGSRIKETLCHYLHITRFISSEFSRMTIFMETENALEEVNTAFEVMNQAFSFNAYGEEERWFFPNEELTRLYCGGMGFLQPPKIYFEEELLGFACEGERGLWTRATRDVIENG